MTFKFNFGGEVDETVEDEQQQDNGQDYMPLTEILIGKQNSIQGTRLPKFEKIQLTKDVALLKNLNQFLRVKRPQGHKASVASQHASIALNSGHLAVSDLVPGKYEGGFKLWECAIDLAVHLCQIWSIQQKLDQTHSKQQSLQEPRTGTLCPKIQGKKVLELGCGHGLPGVLCASLGMEAHFQDYNEEVLRSLTIPNLEANSTSCNSLARSHPSSQFFSGSWEKFPDFLESNGLTGTYDYILSSDTIYSISSQPALLQCISKALKSGGQAFVAAKSHYFGVGGSTDGFKQLIEKEGGLKLIETKILDDGASNRREILTFLKV